MPLAAFPKIFRVKELKKGYFPHLVNTADHQDYQGPIPDKQYYMPEVMSVSSHKEFETWHAAQVATKVQFNFNKELIKCCESDVELLKQGCLTFKRLFYKQGSFNPFDYMAIALVCNCDFCQNRMTPDTIASEPMHMLRMNTNHS